MTTNEIKPRIRDFIKRNFLFSADASLDDDQSLLGTGVVDSTGILELIGFLEGEFSVKFKDADLVAENFDSVNKIAHFVSAKRNT